MTTNCLDIHRYLAEITRVDSLTDDLLLLDTTRAMKVLTTTAIGSEPGRFMSADVLPVVINASSTRPIK